MSYWEIACASVFFQLSLYIAIRLAHRGFTLGELSLVVFGATGLYMELVNLTIARASRLHCMSCSGVELMCELMPTRRSDMACHDPFHQDVPSAHAAVDLPNCAHPRIFADRVPALAAARALAADRPAPRASPPLPT